MIVTKYDQQIDEHMRRLVDDYLADIKLRGLVEVLTYTEDIGLLPVHPSCRCAIVPFKQNLKTWISE